METNQGLRNILQFSFVYDAVQRIVGATSHRNAVVKSLAIPDGAKVVEVGCGPGRILDILGDVHYVGYDPNPRYVQSARETYKERPDCEFVVSDAPSEELYKLVSDCDVMLSLGVLHHLTDKQNREVFSMAAQAVGHKGRFVIYEPYFPEKKDMIGDFFMKRDRGMNVKQLQGWHDLAGEYFSCIKETLHSPVYLLRYSIVVLECSNP